MAITIATAKKAPDIFILEEAGHFWKSLDHMPRGFRMAHVEEIALAWKEDPVFREELIGLPYPVWADRMGVDVFGYYQVDDDGIFVKVNGTEFKTLEEGRRCFLHQGAGPVALSGHDRWNNARLNVTAKPGSDNIAFVAYTAITKPDRLKVLKRAE